MSVLANYSRTTYEHLLCTQTDNRSFYIKIAALLDTDPYFFQGYLEMLWNAEERNDTLLYEDILRSSVKQAERLLRKHQLRVDWGRVATVADLDCLKEVFSIVTRHRGLSLPYRLRALVTITVLTKLLQPITVQAPPEERYLKKMQTLDKEELQKLQQEITSLQPYWWQTETKRQQRISHHQHTHSFVVRRVPNQDISYVALEGVHESIPSEYAERFPGIHATVLRLADELGVALGRVAVVSMKPFAQAYRHTDNEPFLKDRTRYHIPLFCGENNILESGNQKVNVRPGEVWFFDNNVMHRAHNFSPVPRIHIIFDGYPLEKLFNT